MWPSQLVLSSVKWNLRVNRVIKEKPSAKLMKWWFIQLAFWNRIRLFRRKIFLKNVSKNTVFHFPGTIKKNGFDWSSRNQVLRNQKQVFVFLFWKTVFWWRSRDFEISSTDFQKRSQTYLSTETVGKSVWKKIKVCWFFWASGKKRLFWQPQND